ncbi:rubrerythrin family protein [Halorussus gelatinilyticus]|uniref:Rubrerythrin family protein n=1 Tax=Halorussus gelatinilyticus TaxID=2937524 RepID=A0A8U0IE98_9EURY|nr:rubrerythrin family protein [Halorussus gelatinilyticus]UPV99227.1 rubrerythrin family protein [Halorussus gelatinilyticus]
MDADAFPDAIRDAKATELDRLGSQQALVALTDADLDAERVLRAAAWSERTASETFAAWAESAGDAGGTDATGVFAALADEERGHYDRVVAQLDRESDSADESDFADEFDLADESESGEVDPMHEYLRDLDTTVERAAGLVGRSLAGDRTQLQVVNFFVNEADERLADLFRDLRSDTQAGVETGADLLASHCEGEDDWERATEVAERTVQIAYDDYAETLEGMGLDPKPIC